MDAIVLSKSQMKAIVGGDAVIGDSWRKCECNDGITGHLCHNDSDCERQDGPGCWCQVGS